MKMKASAALTGVDGATAAAAAAAAAEVDVDVTKLGNYGDDEPIMEAKRL